MITTEGGLEKVEEALASGATDYLRKPFSSEQLQAKIASLAPGSHPRGVMVV